MDGEKVAVVIEVPRGGRVKRRSSGRIDYLSPLGCPFNYGYVEGTTSGDGDPLDAVLLGPHRPRGHREQVRVWGVVRFVDAGQPDDKLVCGPTPPTDRDWRRVSRFFRLYGRAKGVLNRCRGLTGSTRMVGLEIGP